MPIRSTQIYSVYGVRMQQPAWRPPTDVYETENEIIIQIEIAGMRDGHFRLSCQDRLIVVYGARLDSAQERRSYHQMEVHLGDFRAEVELPLPVNVAAVSADYDDGFLRIVLPKLK